VVETLRIGHSPDADDAFMFYGLVSGKVAIPGYAIEHVLADIETLNRWALDGRLEVTAISAATYPRVADRYRLFRTGASVGRGYGPRLLARDPVDPHELRGRRIAVPGRYTTAYLLLRLFLADFQPVWVPFDAIVSAVQRGDVDAGLVIHESQITYARHGLHLVADLGAWWQATTGLPIPLGVNVVRRDLGDVLAQRIQRALRESIRIAYTELNAAIRYAQQFGRGMDTDTCIRFVRMYVNADTRDLGAEGLRALEELYRQSHAHGYIPTVPVLDPVT